MNRAMNIQKQTKTDLTYYMVMFFLGSVLGWLWEVFVFLVQQDLLVNRGVLKGPWLPIYGVGCVIILLIKKRFGGNLLCFFGVVIVACGLLEYTTSLILETVFHTRWWDYSNEFLNLNGRICPLGLLVFAVAGYLVAYQLAPRMKQLLGNETLPGNAPLMMSCLAFVFLFDATSSLVSPNTGEGITTIVQIAIG